MQRPSDKLYWDNKWAGTLVAQRGTFVMYLEYCLAELSIHPPTSPPLVPLNPSRPSPLLFPSPLMSDVISSQPGNGSCIMKQSSSYSYTIPLPPHPSPSLLARKVLSYRSKSGQSASALDSIFLFLFFLLYQTAKFRLMLEFCYSNFWCIFTWWGLCDCLCAAHRLDRGEVTAGMLVAGAQVKQSHLLMNCTNIPLVLLMVLYFTL